ncbi:MAG: bifunctional UDP-N-acetylglucosamine diphosphorylase/glucosamine-1-phosphate N-acetyltransferase GlmU [Acidobacteria bacterium]|nr:bifunctional UDP-N-acetylglucosamine diphosphorylase/glucosamine-1-phosphate N-acetyltransferase GlmU [Acidobacteriota bacterium]
MSDSHVLVLAAGRSTRMKSSRSKLLHLLREKPLLRHTLENARQAGIVTCVVGRDAGGIADLASECGARIVVQDPPRGTGHAVMAAEESLRGVRGDLLILNGDVPLATIDLLRAFMSFHQHEKATLSVLGTRPPDAAAYGRMVRRGTRLMAITEYLEAGDKARAIQDVNAGIYCARVPDIFPFLKKVGNRNEKGEYYLTDLVGVLNRARRKVCCMIHPAWRELLGVNDRADLEEAEGILNRRKICDLQREGVTVMSGATTFVGDRVQIGPDSVIHPFCSIEGRTTIGSECLILPYSRIVDSSLADRVIVNGSSQIVESIIEDGASVGPFCHLRGSTRVQSGSKVGNFVEMKKTSFGPASKAMHLTYLGDATVEEGVNVGAGTITCNYDGVSKHPTHIGKGVFIGSGTELVAPVEVSDGAYVAAGSTITENVPPGSLAIARARQTVKAGWAEKRKRREPKR